VRRLVADARSSDALVLGTHFPTPTGGRLRAGDGGALRFL
jgi:hypothetical protein